MREPCEVSVPIPPSRLTHRLLAALLAIGLILLFVAPIVPGSARAAGNDARTFLTSASAVNGDGVHHLGFKLAPPADYPQAQLAYKLTAGVPLSASIDLSSQLPPIGDQGQQGSCIGWSSSYYYKTWLEKQEHTGWNTSDTRYDFSPSFVYNQINGGQDQGATFPDAFTLMETKGDVDIAEFPYSQSNYTNQPTTGQLNAAKPYRIPSGWSSFWNQSTYGPFPTPNPIENAKAWLDQGKVLVMGIPIYNDFPNYGSNPTKLYYDYNDTASIGGGHGVCICGYDDNVNPSGSNADHKGGFKMVNSWGSSWNGSYRGYVYLSYDFVKRYVWEAWTMGDLGPDSPRIDGLSSTSGNVGDQVQINGANFGTLRRSAKVTFNGVTASQASFTNERVTATVPAGAMTGPVVVYDWDGVASNGVNFTVGGGSAGPSVTGIDPNTAENSGPVGVAVTGTGFESGCQVKLALAGGEIQATGETLTGSTRVDCTLDLNLAATGAWDVVVTNTDGRSATLAGGFIVTQAGGDGDTYEPNDTIDQAYGPLNAGAAYTSFISRADDDDFYKLAVPAGTSELSATLVSIPADCDYDFYLYDSAGNYVTGSYNAYSADELVKLSSPSQGTYYLEVFPWSGYSAEDSYVVSFTLKSAPAAPVIRGISPSSGVRGTSVTVSGSGFGASRGGSYVAFGSARCASSDYVSWSDGRIVVKVPGGVGGKPQVSVTTGAGRSNATAFSVIPGTTGLSPTSGRAGTWVTISGEGFGGWVSGTTSVYFGSVRASSYYSWSNNRIQVRVPYGIRGTVQVKVRTAGGTSAPRNFYVY